MIFLEDYARWLLVAHTVVAVALVAASTHLVVWTRGYLRGEFSRQRAIRRFSYITLSLFVAGFVLGNLLYPTYKVRVRIQYLENPTAVALERGQRAQTAAIIRQRYERAKAFRQGASIEDATSIQIAAPDSDTAAAAAASASREVAKIARWFDVKEHLAALGLILAAACALILTAWDPKRDGPQIAPIVFGLVLGVAATTWISAIIGVLTASYRAVGG